MSLSSTVSSMIIKNYRVASFTSRTPYESVNEFTSGSLSMWHKCFLKKQWKCPFSLPLKWIFSAHALKDLIIVFGGTSPSAFNINFTIALCSSDFKSHESATQFIPTMDSYLPYSSAPCALEVLFYDTPGVWRYFLQPPGKISHSIFVTLRSLLTDSSIWHS